MEASLGPILASGPTDVAVSNLASRLDRTSRSVCARYNNGKAQDDPTRARHRMVPRGYKNRREMDAFLSLLKEPNVAPEDKGGKWKNHWQRNLSVAHWLLVVLGFQGVDALHPDDSEALHRLRAQVGPAG
jgi:hypothetical protein